MTTGSFWLATPLFLPPSVSTEVYPWPGSIHCKQEVRLSTGAGRNVLVCTLTGDDGALRSQPAGLQSQPETCSCWWVDQLTTTNIREKRPSQEWREVLMRVPQTPC